MKQTPQELIQQAEQLFNEEKFQELIDLLDDDILTEQNNGELYAWRARAHEKLGQTDLALQYARKGIAVSPDNAFVYQSRSLIFYNLKQYANAIEDATRAIAINEKYAWAYNTRGLSWYAQGEYAKAIEDYTKAIQLNAAYAAAYYNRGLAWYALGEYTKSIEDYTGAIRLNEKDAGAYFGRGLAWDAQKEYAKAIEDYAKAINADNKYVKAYNSRGNAWYALKDYKNAIKDYTGAIEIDDKYTIAYFNRGNAWYALKEYDKATQEYTHAILLDEKYADAYYNRGLSWSGLKEYSNAINDYTEAIKLNKSDREAYYYRAIAYKELRQFEKAIEDYKSCIGLTTNADDYLARVALSDIEELNKKIQNDWYNEIDFLVSEIKQLLLFKKPCVTHYTSLSGSKFMILDKSPFRLSEGTFLNDTSEGRELFRYLSFTIAKPKADETIAEAFVERPFIGSFVADNKHNDLTLWRMYGKEAQAEAKGCALTIYKDQLINNLKEKLVPTDSKADTSLQNQGQFTFYKVAYIAKDEFLVPGSSEEEDVQLNKFMKELRDSVNALNDEQRTSITKILNDIAYLFKTAEYQYEYEVRLVVQGVGFKKVINKEATPPKVYIELIDIVPVLHKITLGPKVEKADEWAAAFNYHIEENYPQRSEDVEIVISHLPFK